MKSRIVLAAMVIIGACNVDHSLGEIAQNPGPGPMDAESGSQSSLIDAGSQTYADTQTTFAPEVGAEAQTTSNSNFDAGGIGALGPVQSWTGYIENYRFASGSDTIRLSFASDTSGTVVGKVIFGSGDPPPPATDPDVGYLDTAAVAEEVEGFVEGFEYTMFNGIYSPTRLRFTYVFNEPWAGWCALQTPPSDGSSDCVPGGAICSSICTLRISNGTTLSFDRIKYSLCSSSSVCFCSASGCRERLRSDPLSGSPLNRVLTATFDLTISGSTATGSDSDRLGNTLHFTQDP